MRRRTHIHSLIIVCSLAACGLWLAQSSPLAGQSATASSTDSASPGSQFDANAALQTVTRLCATPRVAGSLAEQQTATFLTQRLRQLGIETHVQDGVVVGRGKKSANVIGILRGEHPAGRILLGAHYDSVPDAPGANDNASGVAMLLEVARVLAEEQDVLRQTVEIAFFGAEEVGATGSLRGSRHYTQLVAFRLDDPLTGMISVDMVGRGDKLVVWQPEAAQGHTAGILAHSARRLALPVQVKIDAKQISDHIAFSQAGVEAVWLQRLPDGANHTKWDRAENVSAEALEQTGKLLLHVVRNGDWPHPRGLTPSRQACVGQQVE